jgi:hypothetical protein
MENTKFFVARNVDGNILSIKWKNSSSGGGGGGGLELCTRGNKRLS